MSTAKVTIAVPNFNRVLLLQICLESILSLVDEDQLDAAAFSHREWIHFIEKNGDYWDLPSDDHHAIDGLERLQSLGAMTIVFGWPAFWWLDYCSGLRDYLETYYRLVAKNTRFKAYRFLP